VTDAAGQLIQAQTTVDEAALAERIAAILVEERLAACVQVLGPIRSTYRWQGALEAATEWLLLVKTTRAAFPALATRLADLHPYDEPELIAFPVEHGSPGYLAWVAANVAPGTVRR